MVCYTFLFVLAELSMLFPSISSATDTFNGSQSLPDGATLVSEDGTFEMGFFSPSNSNTTTNRYLGIWYKSIPVRTVVWVANRENPVKDNSSKLSISTQGKLVILSNNNTLVWSAHTTEETKSQSIIVQLLNSGNLVVRDEKDSSPQNFFWESFDYPCDTFLPGMKIGWNLKKGLIWRFTAWKNWDDPSPGNFSWGMELGNTRELVMWKGSSEYYRSGPWNGVRFSGKYTPRYNLEFNSTPDEVYYTYKFASNSIITRVVLNQSLYSRHRYNWITQNQTWSLYSVVPIDKCDSFNVCGPYGSCNGGEPLHCECLMGFKPKSVQNYEALDSSQGCVPSGPWGCGKTDNDFQKFSGLKLPDTTRSWIHPNLTLESCKAKCLQNCSCIAYANLDIRDGSGCIIWYEALVDLTLASLPGPDLYIRRTASEIEKRGPKILAAVLIPVILLTFVIAFIFTYSYWRKRKHIEKASEESKSESSEGDLDLPFFDFPTIVRATNDFSRDKMLGQGGFGPVYRGTLADGQEIAAKRLCSNTGQGMKEFKNEVILCAKLQHRNLVKLLGCSIEGEEKILVYEYMPNKSLDYFLFDSSRKGILNWSKRLNIIHGIARGLLYLHQDSRLRIIHRDMKASNILLDNELNPKISDFGIARMFRGNQTEGNTKQVVGTYFGILLLEIVSGKRNGGIFFPDHGHNLLEHAWRFWKGDTPMKLVDTSLDDCFNTSEALRCIHVGLLCVQLHPENRPNMASVIFMLSGENILPEPKEPGFLIARMKTAGECSTSNAIKTSTNELTITLPQPR
ncbi:G-type lectin S-receptor-like serine/threonine-protein kinase At4g27290 isoform X2 [Vigna unguiculata]|uniref:G-type lectin S-receptor-like serine/threonine-protein kinase At4g27290 isoform X2 n=1 Tax=Vigna unguiculata TaxID=3917 RepID=UPI0010170699|nr:G-type lectin S-receptor-like serine/threonine-protein kinase At4g27290 isoform X2 [Vigna unguiculata]